jgi:polyisoprenoid-binding protein YceI
MLFRLATLSLVFSLPALAADAPLDARETSIKFTGHATLHDFDGEAQDIRGHAQLDSANPNLVTGAVIDIGVARMTTFSDGRDRNMRAWLRADAEPRIAFRLQKIICTSGHPRQATEKSPALFTVTGTFTLNGQTRPLTAKVTGWRDGALLHVVGLTQIDTTAYGLLIISQFFLTVDKNVDVVFRLAFDLPVEK